MGCTLEHLLQLQPQRFPRNGMQFIHLGKQYTRLDQRSPCLESEILWSRLGRAWSKDPREQPSAVASVPRPTRLCEALQQMDANGGVLPGSTRGTPSKLHIVVFLLISWEINLTIQFPHFKNSASQETAISYPTQWQKDCRPPKLPNAPD